MQFAGSGDCVAVLRRRGLRTAHALREILHCTGHEICRMAGNYPFQLPIMLLQSFSYDDVAQADSLLRATLTDNVRQLEEMPTWHERLFEVGRDFGHIGIKIAVAAAIFILGRWIISMLVKLLDRLMERRKVDVSIRTFVRGFINIVLYATIFYLIITWLGVNTSMVVAFFAAVGLAIGMAMSGVFQNLAGGVMLLTVRPFRVGDTITTQNETGKVIDIRLFNTVLRTEDNRTVLLPNGGVSNAIIENYTSARIRRLEWVFQLRLGTDFSAAKALLSDILMAEKIVLCDPMFEISLSKIARNSIEVTVHAWVPAERYEDVLYSMNWAFYKTMHEKGFHGPSSSLAITITDSEGSQGLSNEASLDSAPPHTDSTDSTPIISVPDPAVKQDFAADFVDDFSGHGQTEPGALVLGAEKRAEDFFLQFLWYAWPVVAHFQMDNAVIIARAHVDGARLHRLLSVFDQVDQALLEHLRVPVHTGEILGEVQRYGDVFFRADLHEFHGLGRQGVGVHRADGLFRGTGEVEDVFQNLVKALGFFQNDIRLLP